MYINIYTYTDAVRGDIGATDGAAMHGTDRVCVAWVTWCTFTARLAAGAQGSGSCKGRRAACLARGRSAPPTMIVPPTVPVKSPPPDRAAYRAAFALSYG